MNGLIGLSFRTSMEPSGEDGECTLRRRREFLTIAHQALGSIPPGECNKGFTYSWSRMPLSWRAAYRFTIAIPSRLSSSRRATSNRSGGALFAEIRVAFDGALSVVRDRSRMPLPGNLDVSRRRGGERIQIHNPDQAT